MIKNIKIKFNSDYDLPPNKTIEIRSMIIAVKFVFHDDKRYNWQVFLDECLYKLQKFKKCCINGIDVSEGTDVKTSELKECNIWYYWYFLYKEFKFYQMSTMGAMIYW